jgi:hypothetical protein
MQLFTVKRYSDENKQSLLSFQYSLLFETQKENFMQIV